MLTLFHKKRTAASSVSKPSSSTTRSGLKPLHLVEKLVAANVIAPQAPPPPPRLNLIGRNKNPRSSLPLSRPSAAKPPRLSLPAQIVKTARAPFVVPLRYSSRVAPRPTSRPSIPEPTPSRRPIRASKAPPVLKAVIPIGRARTSVVSGQNPKVAVNCGKGKTAVTTAHKPRVPSTQSTKPTVVKRPQVKSPKVVALKSPGIPSRIPVFVSRTSTGPYTPSPTPRSSLSRIPRLKYASSPSSPSSTSSGSVVSFNLATPCPSPAQVVEARQMAPKIVVFKTVEVQVTIEDLDIEAIGLIVEACPKLDSAEMEVVEAEGDEDAEPESDATHLSSSGNAESVCVEAPAPTEFRASEEKTDKNQETRSGEEGGGIMGQLIGELKNRLSWGKSKNSNSPYTIDRRGRRRPTSTSNENTVPDTTSELQQAFARRQSATASGTWKSDFMKKQPENKNQNTNTATRKPLAPVPRLNPNVVNGSIHHVLPQTSTPTLVIPTPNLVDSPNDPQPASPPPGAEEDFVVTELVNTAFGTRRVRRLVIPPILESAQPSRDPKIINELKSLRAQQKVMAAVEKTPPLDSSYLSQISVEKDSFAIEAHDQEVQEEGEEMEVVSAGERPSTEAPSAEVEDAEDRECPSAEGTPPALVVEEEETKVESVGTDKRPSGEEYRFAQFQAKKWLIQFQNWSSDMPQLDKKLVKE
ncbi:hypothetical protein B0H16DRAFT_1785241 [Mycena metata]|uniref:Uncharacterized protein n=1 Tax=Mycena metata TaxID=1033252 RepID=A0AAD7NN41_9AGAR|nr:hypothetical protein B0H16DRAFT_1785241 [Mycena metata]